MFVFEIDKIINLIEWHSYYYSWSDLKKKKKRKEN